MKAAELRAVTVRLDVLRDIMVELVTALPPDRATGFAAALGNPPIIDVEMRRGPLHLNVRWPSAAAGDCLVWLRESTLAPSK